MRSCGVSPYLACNVCIIGVTPEQVAQLQARASVPVNPVIVQEIGYKSVFWELAE